MISPNYDIESQKFKSGTIEDCIDLYENRVNGWLLEPAKALLKIPNSGYAVLALALTYFEGYAIYSSGFDSLGKSENDFKQAFNEVFPTAELPSCFSVKKEDIRDKLSDAMYHDARCGFFHDGMCRQRVHIDMENKATAPISTWGHKQTGDVGVIFIRVEKFILEIENHFKRFVDSLRNPSNADLRNNFMKAFKLKMPAGNLSLPTEPIP